MLELLVHPNPILLTTISSLQQWPFVYWASRSAPESSASCPAMSNLRPMCRYNVNAPSPNNCKGVYSMQQCIKSKGKCKAKEANRISRSTTKSVFAHAQCVNGPVTIQLSNERLTSLGSMSVLTRACSICQYSDRQPKPGRPPITFAGLEVG